MQEKKKRPADKERMSINNILRKRSRYMPKNKSEIVWVIRVDRRKKDIIINKSNKGILQLYLCNFHDSCIDAMGSIIKTTIRAPIASLFADFTERASMAIDAARVIALGPKMARSHSRHTLEYHTLLFRELVIMCMVAVEVGAFPNEEI